MNNPSNQYGEAPHIQFPYGMNPAEYYEKKQIKRCGNAIGGAFLIQQALVLIVQAAILIAFFIFLGYSVFSQEASIIQDPFVTWIMQVVLSALMFTVPFIFAAMIMRVRVSNLMPLGKVSPTVFFPLVMVGLGACALGNIATNVFAQAISVFNIQPTQPSIEYPEGILGKVLLTLAVAFTPALVEEFAMRGVVLGSLRRFGDGFAIFMSALLFGLMHGNLIQTPFAFVVGLGLGYVTVASGSMWTAITVHFINNFSSLVLEEITTGMAPGDVSLISLIYMAALLGLGLLGAILYISKFPAGFRLNRPQIVTPRNRVTRYFLTSPCIIISIIIFIINMVLVQVAY